MVTGDRSVNEPVKVIELVPAGQKAPAAQGVPEEDVAPAVQYVPAAQGLAVAVLLPSAVQ